MSHCNAITGVETTGRKSICIYKVASLLTVFSSQAIKKGEQSTIEEWLKDKDTKVNECKGGTALSPPFAVANGTALHWAVYYGQLEIAQLLLSNGAGMYICF